MAGRPKITGRSSSLAAVFVQAIIPRSSDADQLEEGLEKFGIARDQCAYCGAKGSDLDHFFAIVKNKRPSGYFHCAKNLVPSCGTCNQSKGGHHWETWMLGTAKNSPRSRGVSDIEERADKLRRFEEWGGQMPVSEDDLRSAVGAERWDAYWQRLEEIKGLMASAQIEADIIREALAGKFGDTPSV
ncbi:HNH endonuclease signature motif containing protein [Bradyrhizobium sp.]|uniref:HNH endonuclease n=1 Tax=Bradyrhizobium sp. TaxID=376 RepID=UPI00262088C4|nr:HNH endonuclease signature motif containing protein [Bradyrhizobium sp.]